MMAFGCIFGVILLVGPVILLLGLLGQRNPSLPRCRACRVPLTASATIPAQCPGCSVPLTGTRSVAFGGWRPRWIQVGIGGLLVCLTAGFIALSVLRVGAASVGMVNNVVIERSVTTRRFDERTATLDAGAMEWVRAHLFHGELSPELSERAARIVIDGIASGHRQQLGDNVLAIAQAAGHFDPRDLAEATLTAAVDLAPGLVARVVPAGDTVTLVVSPSERTRLMPHLPIPVGMAILELRIDGVRVEPARPDGRAGRLSSTLSASFADPDRRAAGAERIEVDLIVAAFVEEVRGFERGLPGPPERWPTALAERRVTVEAVGGAR